MIFNAVKKVFGSRNDRLIKKHRKVVVQINALEPEFEALSDEQLAGKTQEFRDRLSAGETLDQLLPEAFAPYKTPVFNTGISSLLLERII